MLPRISFSRGNNASIRHNNREFISPNVDKDRVKNNIVIKCEKLSEAYHKIFDEAVSEYNSKQKRKDRMIDNYFVKLFGKEDDNKILRNADDMQSFYEYAIGIGDRHTHGFKTNPEAAEIASICLEEYFKGNEALGIKSFEERNPNFYLANAVIHMDEQTPHAHFDIIPFSDGYAERIRNGKSEQYGLKRNQGIARALEQMGYCSGKDSISEWTKSERALFRKICEAHGIEVAAEEKGRGHTFSPAEYKEMKEMLKGGINEELEAERFDLESEIDCLYTEKSQIQDDISRLDSQKWDKQREYDNLQSELDNVQSELSAKSRDLQICQAIQIPPRPVKPVPPEKPIYYGVDYDTRAIKKFERTEMKQYEKKMQEYIEKELPRYEKECTEWDNLFNPAKAIQQANEQQTKRENEINRALKQCREFFSKARETEAKAKIEAVRIMQQHKENSPFWLAINKANREYLDRYQAEHTHTEQIEPEEISRTRAQQSIQGNIAKPQQKFGALHTQQQIVRSNIKHKSKSKGDYER